MAETIFKEAFGNGPVVRVLDFLIEGRELDYSLTDIARNADIGWTTLHRIWGRFLKLGIVKHTRTIGNAKLFRLNTTSPFVKQLIKTYDTLLVQQNKQALEQRIVLKS